MTSITDHPAGSPAAESAALDAAVLLARTSTPDLLTAAYALTHRIHEADARREFIADRHDLAAAELRAQRDFITAEVLRRTGDAR